VSSALLRFSVVVPTYRRPERLRECLTALTQLDVPRERFEVIVVDDGGDSALDPIVGPFEARLRISWLAAAHGGPSVARNLGAERARGEILAFTGDDCLPHPQWLSMLDRECAAHPGAAVGGQILNALPSNLCAAASQALIEHLYAYYNANPERATFFTPNNLAVPARRFRDIEGFDARFIKASGEDRDFCARWLERGWPMVYAPRAVVRHAHPLSLGAFWRQHVRYGRGSCQYRRARSLRTARALRLERLQFYVGLLRVPPPRSNPWRTTALAALLGIAQVANTTGFAWQYVAERRVRVPGAISAPGHP
jgi:GT2 family glycosyltransferase